MAAMGAAVVVCSGVGLHFARIPQAAARPPAHLVPEENVAEIMWDLEMAMASKSRSFLEEAGKSTSFLDMAGKSTFLASRAIFPNGGHQCCDRELESDSPA
jgi:hypothetical protein